MKIKKLRILRNAKLQEIDVRFQAKIDSGYWYSWTHEEWAKEKAEVLKWYSIQLESLPEDEFKKFKEEEGQLNLEVENALLKEKVKKLEKEYDASVYDLRARSRDSLLDCFIVPLAAA